MTVRKVKIYYGLLTDLVTPEENVKIMLMNVHEHQIYVETTLPVQTLSVHTGVPVKMDMSNNQRVHVFVRSDYEITNC